ncbi:MAG TPA: ATP-dependent DNA helicase [Albitalea sp.]
MSAPAYTVGVRELCEFTAKHGDLDLRFTPAPTALEGIEGHAVVARRRGPGYQAELALEEAFGALRVRGRADGYDPDRRLLEEVKTHRGDVARIPDNHRRLHQAQARIYAWMLCRRHALPEIDVAVVYFDIDSQNETAVVERCGAEALRAFFEAQCGAFLRWAEQELAHRARRDAALVALPFPHAGFRPGQRVLAEAVYNAARSGRCLMAQAPTGIGKTLGTLFPLLKACPTQSLDKVFYLAAKTSGRQLALDALARVAPHEERPSLRIVELTARDKACEHPDKACHGESCPLARGFYDRLPEARRAAVEHGFLDRAALRRIALAHEVCPYYLGQALARWSDVVVGDYNYFFDLGAFLHRMSVSNEWRVGVLVDEAHNLVERSRAMYSAEIDLRALEAVRRGAPVMLKRPLNRLHRHWKAFAKAQTAPYAVHAGPPAALSDALRQLLSAIGDHLAENPFGVDAALLEFHFAALHFARLLELLDPHSQFDQTVPAGGKGSRLCVRNVIPAPFLKDRFAAARCTVLFSATLAPTGFYADVLGLPDDSAAIDIDSHFSAEQLQVRIVDGVSTRWADRTASLQPIADLIAAQYGRAPGNYFAFFSSFDYLEQAAAMLQQRHPQIPTWQQSRSMNEAEREAFVARFAEGGQGVGFAVLGGAFAEGIDLPGSRLIGAFIATLGLPQVNPVNEQMRRRLHARFGDGYAYTYLVPGLRKVVQAAGRIIRTESDRGALFLIDDRFGSRQARALLPAWWRIERGNS